jgi:hypothetical protein
LGRFQYDSKSKLALLRSPPPACLDASVPGITFANYALPSPRETCAHADNTVLATASSARCRKGCLLAKCQIKCLAAGPCLSRTRRSARKPVFLRPLSVSPWRSSASRWLHGLRRATGAICQGDCTKRGCVTSTRLPQTARTSDQLPVNVGAAEPAGCSALMSMLRPGIASRASLWGIARRIRGRVEQNPNLLGQPTRTIGHQF